VDPLREFAPEEVAAMNLLSARTASTIAITT